MRALVVKYFDYYKFFNELSFILQLFVLPRRLFFNRENIHLKKASSTSI